MNTIIIISLVICVGAATGFVLPELHVIKHITLKHPYGCPPTTRFQDAAIFLTDYGVTRNMPDLLYAGACGSDNYFDVMLAGDDFGMITDLGNVALENVTASKAFNYLNTVGQDNKFTKTIKVINGHTYAALLAKQEIRALFIFRVENYLPSGPITLSYAVKQYGIIQSVQEAPGFSWYTPNH